MMTTFILNFQLPLITTLYQINNKVSSMRLTDLANKPAALLSQRFSLMFMARTKSAHVNITCNLCLTDPKINDFIILYFLMMLFKNLEDPFFWFSKFRQRLSNLPCCPYSRQSL